MRFGMILGVLGASLLVFGAFRFATRHRHAQPEVLASNWSPPKTSIDPNYLDAIKALLGNGLADPRGGQFSSVKIRLGDAVSDRAGELDAYGWVFPDGKRAVLVDGVQYFNVESHTPLDLDSAVNELLAPRSRLRYGSLTIPVGTATPALPGLFLLSGNPGLAERVFDGVGGSSPIETLSSRLFEELRQRYEMLAADALMNRRDLEGLEWARRLTTVAMVHDGFHFAPSSYRELKVPPSNLPFARALLADFERRVDNPKKQPVDVQATLKLDPPARIAALIDAMDTIGAPLSPMGSGVNYLGDPVFKALTDQGAAAVPALLDVMEQDHRFTRSVSFDGRDARPERSIHSVKDAAWHAVLCIWPSVVSVPGVSPPNKPDAKLLRTAWASQGTLSEPERWLNVLRDNNAGSQLWLQACRFLIKPVDEVWLGNSGYTMPTHPSSVMTGEPLRATHGSDVVELISKRALESASKRENSSMDAFRAGDALRMAHCLAHWDLAKSLDCLKSVCDVVSASAPELARSADPNNTFAGPYGQAIADRLQAGDQTVAPEYEKLLSSLKLNEGFYDNRIFAPLWSAPNDRAIQKIGADFMHGWAVGLSSTDPKTAAGYLYAAHSLAAFSPMLTVQSYREVLIAGLRCANPLGTMAPDPTGKYLRYQIAGGGGGTWNLDQGGSITQQAPLSVRDYLAQMISICGFKGLPKFQICAPDKTRAAQRERLVDMLSDGRRDWLAIAKTSPFFDSSTRDL